MISELKALQEENRRLKKMYAEVQLQKDILEKQSSTMVSALNLRAGRFP